MAYLARLKTVAGQVEPPIVQRSSGGATFALFWEFGYPIKGQRLRPRRWHGVDTKVSGRREGGALCSSRRGSSLPQRHPILAARPTLHREHRRKKAGWRSRVQRSYGRLPCRWSHRLAPERLAKTRSSIDRAARIGGQRSVRRRLRPESKSSTLLNVSRHAARFMNEPDRHQVAIKFPVAVLESSADLVAEL